MTKCKCILKFLNSCVNRSISKIQIVYIIIEYYGLDSTYRL